MASQTPSDVDIVRNQINVALAKSKRVVELWLPPLTPDEAAKQRSPEQLAEEEKALFAPIPPRLGLGAPIPKDFLEGDANKPNQLTSNDLLRRRLLGKKSSKITARNSEDINKAPLTRTPKAPIEVESEEDQGRSSLGAMKGKKRTRKAITSKGTAVGILSGERTESADERNAEADADEAVKGSNSFLDQVLRENERKRRRKEKKARKREIEKQIKARENG